MKLQGKGFLAYELLVEITSFQVKLALFSEQLSEQNFSHFFLTVQLRELSKLWRDITNRCNVKASVFIGFGCADCRRAQLLYSVSNFVRPNRAKVLNSLLERLYMFLK